MRILLALDKFKGSLTAKQASDAVTGGLRRGGFGGEVAVCPIADGGEGFTEAVLTALGGGWCETSVHDAQGREVTARYGLIEHEGHTEAIMEMSAASGLAMVSDLPLNPLTATTRGTGEMMLDARRRGARRILIGIGGSATNDGGTGMAAELGWRFLDAQGNAVVNLPADLERVERIERGPAFGCEVIVACDVINPLLGDHGCSAVYGPQKGVTDVERFDNRLRRLAAMVVRDLGCDCREAPGAGAAGGLGFGLMSFCDARLQSGFDLVAEVTGLRERIMQADLVITGEGRLDAQTLDGKGPIGIAAMARLLGKRVAGIGGVIQDNPTLRASFDLLLAAKPPDMPIPEAIARAADLLEETVARHVDSLTALVRNPPRN